MKKEIRILLEEGESNKAKGNCFENLVRNLISINNYEVRGNINFSGMEIDLVATHKHTHETLYVECKAKERVKGQKGIVYNWFNNLTNVDDIRFFTQTELEKLQTMPTGYTSLFPRNKAAGLIGNAFTVDVIAHIFKNIK